MKNIHIIPTNPNDETGGGIWIKKTRDWCNIYITNYEEIEDVRPYKGKWQLEQGRILNKFPTYLTDLSECKLVIMTTDHKLIKDGVQEMDDEFLEWFVKNPSCEEVEVDLDYESGLRIINGENLGYYSIIIPQEEPEQSLKEVLLQIRKVPMIFSPNDDPKQEEIDFIAKELTLEKERGIIITQVGVQEELKQETLEEIEKPIGSFIIENAISIQGADGAYYHYSEVCKLLKLQQERSYSEEEVLELLRKAHFVEQNIEEWFEQFKKK